MVFVLVFYFFKVGDFVKTFGKLAGDLDDIL